MVDETTKEKTVDRALLSGKVYATRTKTTNEKIHYLNVDKTKEQVTKLTEKNKELEEWNNNLNW